MSTPLQLCQCKKKYERASTSKNCLQTVATQSVIIWLSWDQLLCLANLRIEHSIFRVGSEILRLLTAGNTAQQTLRVTANFLPVFLWPSKQDITLYLVAQKFICIYLFLSSRLTYVQQWANFMTAPFLCVFVVCECCYHFIDQNAGQNVTQNCSNVPAL